MQEVKKNIVGTLKAMLLPLVVYCIFKAIRPQTFGTLNGLYIILQQAMITIIISLAICNNMTIGIWDFSAGSIVTLVGCICGYYFNQYGFVAMLASAIISGILLGLINASVYTILRIPSVVVTVGLMLIYESFATVYKGGKGFSITKKASFWGLRPGFLLLQLYCLL